MWQMDKTFHTAIICANIWTTSGGGLGSTICAALWIVFAVVIWLDNRDKEA